MTTGSAKQPTLLQAVIPLLGLLVCLGGGYAVLKLPTQICLLGAALIAAAVAKWIGLDWETMLAGIREKISSSFGSMLVMICVGGMISSWIYSGTIPMLIYYGIEYLPWAVLCYTSFLFAILFGYTGLCISRKDDSSNGFAK